MKVPQTNARGRGVDHTRTCSGPAQTAQLLHFFSAVVSCYTLPHTMELANDMVELMLPNGSNSTPQDLVVYVESTLPKHEEMSLDQYHLFTITSMDKAFEVTKVKVRCIKVWWTYSSGLFLSLWPLPLSFDARLVAKNISGRPTNTLQTHWHSSIHGIRFMINRVMVLFLTLMPQDFYWCRHHHFQIRIQTIDFDKCLQCCRS